MGFSTVSAYVIGVIVMLVMLGLSIFVANKIDFQIGANRTDGKKRKVWFLIFAILTPILVFAISYFFQYNSLRVPSQKAGYFTAMSIASAISFVGYIIIGAIISLTNKKGKVGDWFKF